MVTGDRALDDWPPSPWEVCRALRQARARANLTQEELARRLRVTQGHVSRWESGRVPKLDVLARIETEGLGLVPGDLLRRAGFVRDPSTTEEAILSDPHLQDEDKALIIDVLRAAIRRRLPISPD